MALCRHYTQHSVPQLTCKGPFKKSRWFNRQSNALANMTNYLDNILSRATSIGAPLRKVAWGQVAGLRVVVPQSSFPQDIAITINWINPERRPRQHILNLAWTVHWDIFILSLFVFPFCVQGIWPKRFFFQWRKQVQKEQDEEEDERQKDLKKKQTELETKQNEMEEKRKEKLKDKYRGPAYHVPVSPSAGAKTSKINSNTAVH